MTDNLSPLQRSDTMGKVRSRNTSPEMVVRKLCRSIGAVGYRLHRSDIPGRPDLAFVGQRKAIFVHGCFWHGHNCTSGQKRPKTNTAYWEEKLNRNKVRDEGNLDLLGRRGWTTLIIWECELRSMELVIHKLKAFLNCK